MKSGFFFAAFALLQAAVMAAPLESKRAIITRREGTKPIKRGKLASKGRDVFEDEDFDVETAVFSDGAKWVKQKRAPVEEDIDFDIEQTLQYVWADKRAPVEEEDFDIETAVFSGGAKWVKDKRTPVEAEDIDFDIEQTLQYVWADKRAPVETEDIDFDVEQTLQYVWADK